MAVNQGDNLVFIGGCPRSGTTWLQRLIASHPLVRTGQESFVIPWYVHPIAQRWKKDVKNPAPAAVGLSAYLNESQGKELIARYVWMMMDSITGNLPPGVIFLEKTPANSLYIEEIMEYIPKAKFIHIIRDGRDVVSSLLAASKTWGFKPWGNLNSYTAAKLWVRHLDAVKNSKKSVPKGQFFELKYETLLDSPEELLEAISNFLGIEWPKDQIKEAVQRNALSSELEQRTKLAVGGEKAKKFENEGRTAAEFGSHSTSEKRRGLNPLQRFMVWMAARDTLKQYGYEKARKSGLSGS
jgi:hypothetical protein